jgi:hypothetical protein
VTAWSSEELRRAALDALGEHADERAREALRHASIGIVDAASEWSGTGGTVQAHRVTLAIEARTLGGLRAAPALADALCAAMASALAARPGETLMDLSLRWAPGRRPVATGYRDAPPSTPETSLHDALLEYLEGNGAEALARSLGDFTLATTPEGVLSVRMEPPANALFRADAHAMAVLTAALRDLLGDEKARIRLG